MKLLALVIAALASLVVGCAAPVEVDAPAPVPVQTTAPAGWSYSVTENPSLTDAQVMEIGTALGAWEAAVPGLKFTVSEGATPNAIHTFHTILIQPVTSAQLASFGTAGDEELGVTQRLSGPDDAWISLDPSAPDQVQTITHEIGHAMGLVHTLSGIMCRSEECASTSILPIDVAQFIATRPRLISARHRRKRDLESSPAVSIVP